MGFAANIDLGERSNQLVPSSGWIGDIIIPFSNLTGIWDILLLSVLFIVSWTGIRTSERVVALILARVFDTTIPLQHYLSSNAAVQQLHAAHCERYWHICYFATAVEAAAYFLFHPDLFTLVTCFKTTLMVVVWHGRNADGTFWTSGVKSATASRATATSTETSAQRDIRKQKQWTDYLTKKNFSISAQKEMLEALKGTTSKEEKALLTEWSKADKFKNLN